MSIKLGKREHQKMVAVLESDHESVDEAADAALRVALDILESRASFVVVGQLARTKAGSVDPSDPEAVKVCIDFYSTEGAARSAAETLAIAHATSEEWRVWVLPVAHCTTAALLSERKASLQAAEEKRAEAERKRFQEQIQKHAKAREEQVKQFAAEQAA